MIFESILKLKNYKLFLLLFICFIFPLVMDKTILHLSHTKEPIYFLISSTCDILIISLWFYNIGYMISNINYSEKINFTIFKYSIIFDIFYCLTGMILIFYMMQHKFTNPFILFGKNIGAIVFIGLGFGYFITFFTNIYIIRFLSKNILEIEYKRECKFIGYSGLMMLFALLPIGIWIIQPTINKLYQQYIQDKDDLKTTIPS